MGKNNDKPRIKILFVEAGHGMGGSARSLAANLGRLGGAGVEAVVYMPLPGADSGLFDALGVPVIRKAAEGGEKINAPSGWGEFARKFLARDLPEARRLAGTLRRNAFDLVHGNNDISSNMIALAAARMAGVPYVQHLRTTRRPTRSERAAARFAARFVTVSRWGASMLDERFPETRGRLDVIRNVFEEPAVSPDAPVDLSCGDGVFTAAMFSNLVRGKGHPEFLRAAESLLKEGLEAEFLVFGNDVPGHEDYASEVRALVAKSSFPEAVCFMGYRSSVADYMARVDAVVEASSLPEGLQRTLIEAGMLGRAAVSSRSGGAGEVVVHGETGLFFDAGDADGLAEGLGELAKDRVLVERLGRGLREKVRAEFDADKSVAALIALYEKHIF